MLDLHLGRGTPRYWVVELFIWNRTLSEHHPGAISGWHRCVGRVVDMVVLVCGHIRYLVCCPHLLVGRGCSKATRSNLGFGVGGPGRAGGKLELELKFGLGLEVF